MIKCLLIVGFSIAMALALIVFIYFLTQAMVVGFYRGKDIYIKNRMVKNNDQKEQED